MPRLKAIEVCIDYPSRGPTSPTIQKLIPVFKKIQNYKPLILGGTVTDEELRLLLEELSPRGLAVASAVVKQSPQ
jgi:triosephosphate isomerase